MSKRIIAFLVVFSSLLSFVIIPVFASDDDYSSLDTVGFWEAMLHDGIIGGITDGLDIFLGTSFVETNFVNKVSSALTSSYCDKSDDGWHHCQGKDLYLSGNDVMGECSLCGKAFDVTDDAVNQLKEAYGKPAGHGLGGSTGDDPVVGGFGYVKKVEDELGTTTVGSSGLLLPISVKFQISSVSDFVSTTGHNFFASGILYNSTWPIYVAVILDTPDVAPISGYYKLVGDVNFVQEGGVLDPYLGRSISCVAGHEINLGNTAKRLFRFTSLGLFELSGSLFFEVTPLSSYDVNTYTANIGGIDSRATSFTGDIGIIGDNGQLTKVEGDQIFNETTNNYYNPSTGTTSTVTVTYGDENITIQEGDTVYNVYYIIEGSASSDPCPEGGAHDWQPGETVDATCTVAGFKTETCSKCGEERTTELPALGHKWKVKQSVQTKYDENGELLQQGYTIYECERCGEQYKSTDNTGPPAIDPGGSGGDDGGGSIWDSIVEFFKNIASSFASLPDWFGRFSEFLSSAFSYLPEEIILLLTFGVFTVVAIGVWKAVRR